MQLVCLEGDSGQVFKVLWDGLRDQDQKLMIQAAWPGVEEGETLSTAELSGPRYSLNLHPHVHEQKKQAM